ncbi:hypothetical protein HFP05_01980 [Rhodanobacter denitrificans]|nr:hypothetical protein [Rhodanobacter denitrificans]
MEAISPTMPGVGRHCTEYSALASFQEISKRILLVWVFKVPPVVSLIDTAALSLHTRLIAMDQRVATSAVKPPPPSVAPISTLTVSAVDVAEVDSSYTAGHVLTPSP